MGGITGSFAVTVGGGLSGAGTPASPLVNTGVTSFNGSGGAVTGVSSFIGQTGAVDPSALNAIGSVVTGAVTIPNNTTLGEGSTVAGSSIIRSFDGTNGAGVQTAFGLYAVGNISETALGPVSMGLSGTWRVMCRIRNTVGSTYAVGGIFVRIA